jgi:hypothetical protein
MLEWTTLSEINNYGFEIQMSVLDSVHYTTLPGSFIPGHGTTNTPHTYQFAVSNPPAAAFYRLKQTDLDGSIWFSEGIRIVALTGLKEGEIPTVFALFQSYPNPFNPSTRISYDVPTSSHVNIEVFNMLGAHVATLVNEMRLPGRYSVSFEAGDLPSGLYFYRLKSESYTEVKRMLLMK